MVEVAGGKVGMMSAASWNFRKPRRADEYCFQVFRARLALAKFDRSSASSSGIPCRSDKTRGSKLPTKEYFEVSDGSGEIE